MPDHTLSGAGAPASTPSYIGQNYRDTTNNRWYKAKGTASSADWVAEPTSGGTLLASTTLGADAATVACSFTPTAGKRLIVALRSAKIDTARNIRLTAKEGGSGGTIIQIRGSSTLANYIDVNYGNLAVDKELDLELDWWNRSSGIRGVRRNARGFLDAATSGAPYPWAMGPSSLGYLATYETTGLIDYIEFSLNGAGNYRAGTVLEIWETSTL